MLPRFPLPALSLALVLAPAPSIDKAIELHTAGRLPEALREYHAVVAAGAGPEVAATALNNACALQMGLGDYRAALPDCREALRRLRAEKDPGALGRALNNLGMALEGLGETEEAEARFREALELNRKTGNAESETVNLSNLGALAVATGRYAAALDLHARAAALAESHRGEPWAGEQIRIARINQGVVLEKVGAYREALEIYKQALAGGEADPDRRAALRVNSGVIYRNLGDPVKAIDSFREAIGLYQKAGDTAGLSNANLNLALALHLNLERPDEAETAYREALRLAVASGDRTEEIQDLFYLGRLLLGQGRGEEAGEVFRRCLAAAEASGSAEGKWSAREGLGRLARAQGDLAGALGHFEAALGEIERVRAGLARGTRRSGYFGDKRAVYAAAVETLAELDRREPGRGWGDRALGIVERAKARDLLDVLGAGHGSARPLNAAALREETGHGVTLEYFLGESNLYLWVIRSGGVRFHDLGPRQPVLDGAASVHRALSHGEAPPAAAVTALSRVLLGPLRTASGELLRIAPDGALRHLPFELLEQTPGTPLVERWAVAYLPSASTLARPGISRFDAVGLLGVADPWLPRPRSGPSSPRDLLVERFGLAPLVAAEWEVGTAERLLGLRGQTVFLTHGQATEKAFRDAVVRGAGVVHLAAHAVIDERPGRGAAILLAPYGEEDGLLTPEEIAALDARTNLTVLAACRTALGPEEDGRALSSLTGAFLAAGSRGVVATLWDVGDAATAAFMEQFYWELSRGLTPAKALAEAKRRLRADPRWRRPDLWAGYVLVGEPPPVIQRRLPEGLGIFFFALALLGRGLLDLWRRRRPTG